MTIKEFRQILQVLEIPKVGDNESFDADHDIIYIPWGRKTGETAERLEAIGCHWDENADSWAIF